MSNCTRYLGLDVHAETINAAIAEGRRQIRSLGKFPNRPDAVRRLIERLGGSKHLKVCYESGPTGYALYWQLTKLGVDCEVIAPSLIPKKASDKVKTDRRDAEKLAQSYQAGDLTPVWVPSPEHEALRDLVRRYPRSHCGGFVRLQRLVGRSLARYHRFMQSFTAVIERDEATGLFVGYVPGWPGAHSQGATLDELRQNLEEVTAMLLEDGAARLEGEFVGTQTVKVA